MVVRSMSAGAGRHLPLGALILMMAAGAAGCSAPERIVLRPQPASVVVTAPKVQHAARARQRRPATASTGCAKTDVAVAPPNKDELFRAFTVAEEARALQGPAETPVPATAPCRVARP